MVSFFSRSLAMMSCLLLWSCSEPEPPVIAPPKDVAAVVEPFLKAVAKGDRTAASAFVSTAAQDELDQQFAADHGFLAKAPPLTPRFQTDSGQKVRAMGQEFAADGREVTLVYAGRADGKWTTATVRVYRYREEPYKIEYWRVSRDEPQPALRSGIDLEKLKQVENQMRWVFGGLAVLGGLGLAFLIWLLRRKPHLVVAATPEETRRTASTVREE